MKLLKFAYEKINKRPAPYYYDYSPLTVIKKPIRKWITNVVAYNCPFNCVRILLYRLCGFDIGKRTFIGMHCYLDDLRYDLMHIGNDVIISYGVYFACHGRNQVSQPITIKDGAYVGMRATIISKNADIPGGGYWRRCNYRGESGYRFLCISQPRCSFRRYSCWNTLSDYRKNRGCNRRIEFSHLESEVAA